MGFNFILPFIHCALLFGMFIFHFFLSSDMLVFVICYLAYTPIFSIVIFYCLLYS
jgi:hypothetical protein